MSASITRGSRRPARWLTSPATFAVRQEEGTGRDRVRSYIRQERDEQLRRGCLLILGRAERANRSGQRESTRRLLAETQRLEHARRAAGRSAS